MKKEIDLNIIHFNDVYQLEDGKSTPIGGIARFVAKLDELKSKNSLVVFSGDLWSPSKMSMVFEGKQMVKAINRCGVHVSCLGNHDLDFGVATCESLIKETNCPWLLSNVTFADGKPIAGTQKSHILEHNNLKIGFMGLAEWDWLSTLGMIDAVDLEYEDFIETAIKMVAEFEEKNCDLIIAVTHMREPNDLKLAQAVPKINLVLGGHDHLYCVHNMGHNLMIKSGADFKTFNLINLSNVKQNDFLECPRQFVKDEDVKNEQSLHYYISNQYYVRVQRFDIIASIYPNAEMVEYVKKLQESFDAGSVKKIGKTKTSLDTTFGTVRTKECPFGNFISDLCRIYMGADGAIIQGGVLRSDIIFPEGFITIDDIQAILPFRSKLELLHMSGEVLISALEHAVSKYPVMEGRFLHISNIEFKFNNKLPPYQRVAKSSVKIMGNPIIEQKMYLVACPKYIANGKDGFDCLIQCEKEVQHTEVVISDILNNFFQIANLPEVEAEWKIFAANSFSIPKFNIADEYKQLYLTKSFSVKYEFNSESNASKTSKTNHQNDLNEDISIPFLKKSSHSMILTPKKRTKKYINNENDILHLLKGDRAVGDEIFDRTLIRRVKLYRLVDSIVQENGQKYFLINPKLENRIQLSTEAQVCQAEARLVNFDIDKQIKNLRMQHY